MIGSLPLGFRMILRVCRHRWSWEVSRVRLSVHLVSLPLRRRAVRPACLFLRPSSCRVVFAGVNAIIWALSFPTIDQTSATNTKNYTIMPTKFYSCRLAICLVNHDRQITWPNYISGNLMNPSGQAGAANRAKMALASINDTSRRGTSNTADEAKIFYCDLPAHDDLSAGMAG